MDDFDPYATAVRALIGFYARDIGSPAVIAETMRAWRDLSAGRQRAPQVDEVLDVAGRRLEMLMRRRGLVRSTAHPGAAGPGRHLRVAGRGGVAELPRR